MTKALTVQSFATDERTLKIAEYFNGPGDRFQPWVKSALILISNTPTLQECMGTTDGQASLYQSLRFASSAGLSLNPQEGKATIIAYKGKAQFQIMKNGMMELVERSGRVEFISSDTVRENDHFDIEKTANGDEYSFKPFRKDRGDIDGFYAAIKLKDGPCHVKYMTMQEVIDFRDKYSSGYKFAKNKQEAAWGKSIEGMGLKTVIKALLRNISISPEITAAIGIDDQSEASPEEKNITPPKKSTPELAMEAMEVDHVAESDQVMDFNPSNQEGK